jgi:hypothetical protein
MILTSTTQYKCNYNINNYSRTTNISRVNEQHSLNVTKVMCVVSAWVNCRCCLVTRDLFPIGKQQWFIAWVNCRCCSVKPLLQVSNH